MIKNSKKNAYILGDELTIVEGKGGFPFIKIDNEFASSLISIYGAQVLSFIPKSKDDKDVFFISDKAYFEEGRAIKGGIPICWPWFGRSVENPDLQIHGFARNMLWEIEDTSSESSGETKVVLSLRESEDSMKLWPHNFRLTLTIVVGKTLSLSLQTTNTGEDTFSITQALHPYFSISEISQMQVNGLGGVDYLDKVTGAETAITQIGEIRVEQEVDRIYIDAPSETSIVDHKFDRKILIKTKGSKTTVVWNPWTEISKNSKDLEDDSYLKFICVEAANAAEDIVAIALNESHTLEAEISVS